MLAIIGWHGSSAKLMGSRTMLASLSILQLAPSVEKAFIEPSIIPLKYWLEVSPEEQTRRLEA
jgi:polyphosphate kinase 2 (PPK2 family)